MKTRLERMATGVYPDTLHQIDDIDALVREQLQREYETAKVNNQALQATMVARPLYNIHCRRWLAQHWGVNEDTLPTGVLES
jgi:hypothetical protein